VTWIRRDNYNNIISVMNDDPWKILHDDVASQYIQAEDEYTEGFFVNGKLVTENKKQEIHEFHEKITEFTKASEDLGIKKNVEFDKVINFKAFMLKLSGEQRFKILNYTKYAIDEHRADSISALLAAFNELGGLSVKSKVFTDGIAALVTSSIIEPNRIEYIVG